MQTSDSPSSSRALVRLVPDTHESHPHRAIQRVSTFLTHLIATARHLPQTCERRRADPADVIAAYRATVKNQNAERKIRVIAATFK